MPPNPDIRGDYQEYLSVLGKLWPTVLRQGWVLALVSDLDIFRTASVLIREHGGLAVVEAKEQR